MLESLKEISSHYHCSPFLNDYERPHSFRTRQPLLFEISVACLKENWHTTIQIYKNFHSYVQQDT